MKYLLFPVASLFSILLIIHIVTGGISLLLGAYIMIARKGSKQHRLLGNIYFSMMLAAALVALPMSYLHPNYFLFIIGIFTTYMLVTGRRYLRKPAPANTLDWMLAYGMLTFGLLFIGLGIFNIVKGNMFGVVFIVFGAISLLFVYQDRMNFSGRSNIRNYGLTTHLQRMIGSYVAAATAFIVVNNKVLPGIVAWLLPTFIIVPLIVRWTRKYKVVQGA